MGFKDGGIGSIAGWVDGICGFMTLFYDRFLWGLGIVLYLLCGRVG